MSLQPAAQRVATISDVARDAGVSVATVSKTLNNTGQLREATRQRVRQSVERLAYVPNAFARSLNSKRSYTVGLLTNDSFGRFSMPILLGAEDALGSGKMSVFLCDTRDDHIREAHYIKMLLSRRVDGFIVTGRFADARSPVDIPAGVPVVYAMTPSADPVQASIRLDNARGGEMAVDYLVATGRRRIAHVSGTRHHESAKARSAGAQTALERAGLALVGGTPLFGDWSEEWGRQAAQIVASIDPEVDAIFAGSDQVARGVIDGLGLTRRRVPEDVAVVGYDNWDVMVNGRRPSLSSVEPQLHVLGQLAARELMTMIGGQPVTGTQWITPELVIRQSSDPAFRPPG